MEAVRQYRFKPGTENGKPVATYLNVEVNFEVDPAAPVVVQTGEATASNLSMSTTQTSAGTVNVGTEAAFGTRFAFYVQHITQKVAAQWYPQMLDPQATGHRVYITFQVERDGSLTHIVLAQPSRDPTLDSNALNAVRHIDTFGPLPDAYSGSHINVTYYFDPPPHSAAPAVLQTEPAYPAPTTPPAISPSGSIMVQIAAVSSQDVADILLASLQKKGYSVSVRHGPQDNLLYVQIGPFATRQEAVAMQQRVLADGFNAIVK
jgi:TonB family protein